VSLSERVLWKRMQSNPIAARRTGPALEAHPIEPMNSMAEANTAGDSLGTG